MTHDEHFLKLRPAQVEEPVLQAKLFVGVAGLDVERRCGTFVVHLKFGNPHFHLSGGQLGVFFTGQTLGNSALNTDTEFTSEVAGGGDQSLALIRLKHDLRDAVAVSEVDKNQSAEVAVGVHPAIQNHGLADIFGSQFTTVVRTFEHEPLVKFSRWAENNRDGKHSGGSTDEPTLHISIQDMKMHLSYRFIGFFSSQDYANPSESGTCRIL